MKNYYSLKIGYGFGVPSRICLRGGCHKCHIYHIEMKNWKKRPLEFSKIKGEYYWVIFVNHKNMLAKKSSQKRFESICIIIQIRTARNSKQTINALLISFTKLLDKANVVLQFKSAELYRTSIFHNMP